MSLFNLATSLKHKNRNYETHFRLAMLLEEKELFESIYGKEKEVKKLVLNLGFVKNNFKFYNK
jgi:ribosomal protein S4